MTSREEAIFEAKAEKSFKSHRGVPDGRNFACWGHDETKDTCKKYRKNFDLCFPNSPGAGF